MADKLNLNKLYSDFNSENINKDINKINIFILDLKKLFNNHMNIYILENFLLISNNIILLMDKLYAYARLNLYLNTNNCDAIILLRKMENLELLFKKTQIPFIKILSLKLIEEYCVISPYICEHRYYLLHLLKNDNLNFDSIFDLSYEQDYNKLISSQKITIDKKVYPINLTLYDLFYNMELKNIRKEYIELRNNLFDKNSIFYSNIFYNIKKETINMASSLGYSSPLEMSLSYAGFSKEMLKILLTTINKNKNIFSKFLCADLDKNPNNTAYTITEAKKIIVDSFAVFDSSLSKLAINMFDNNFLDLSNSKNKIIGSCHLKILTLKESRIVGHFTGTIKDIFQIAHEFGHAYQNNIIMNSQTPLNSNIPTSTCEIISLFCELLVLDYLLKNTKKKAEKQMILSYFITYSMQAILDVYSRFSFEYEAFNLISKTNSPISYNKLNTLMVSSQTNAYNNIDTFVDKYLWIYKPHFYSVSVPYYNYAYALGILFAFLLFDKYTELNKKDFLKSFKEFCELSACSNISDLSLKFNIDLLDSSCFYNSFSQLDKLINKFLSK